MPETPKDKDQEKGDEVLRRLLKTPPEPKSGKENGKEPHEKRDHKEISRSRGDANRPRISRSS